MEDGIPDKDKINGIPEELSSDSDSDLQEKYNDSSLFINKKT